MAAFSGLGIRYVHTDFPTRREGPGRRYDLIDDADADGYWGDTVRYPSEAVGLPLAPDGDRARASAVVGQPGVRGVRELRRGGRRTPSPSIAETCPPAGAERSER